MVLRWFDIQKFAETMDWLSTAVNFNTTHQPLNSLIHIRSHPSNLLQYRVERVQFPVSIYDIMLFNFPSSRAQSFSFKLLVNLDLKHAFSFEYLLCYNKFGEGAHKLKVISFPLLSNIWIPQSNNFFWHTKLIYVTSGSVNRLLK